MSGPCELPLPPMRIAMISAIHGNLIVLRSVIANIERGGVDRIVCVGDVANLRTAPVETLDRHHTARRSLSPPAA